MKRTLKSVRLMAMVLAAFIIIVTGITIALGAMTSAAVYGMLYMVFVAVVLVPLGALGGITIGWGVAVVVEYVLAWVKSVRTGHPMSDFLDDSDE